MTVSEYANSRNVSASSVYMWIYRHADKELQGHVSRKNKKKHSGYILDDEAVAILDEWSKKKKVPEKAEKIVRPPFRETRVGKLVRILVINGECLRSDVTNMFGGVSVDTANVLYRYSDAFTTIIPSRYDKLLKNKKKMKWGERSLKFDGHVIRPKLTRDSGKTTKTKKANTPKFKRLVYRLDNTGRAWNYFMTNIWENGTVRARERTMYRNTYISRVLMRLMDIYDIDHWNRPELSKLAEIKQIPVNTFFSASEVKGFNKVGQLEHASSTATGVLATPAGVFVTYCMNREPNMETWKAVYTEPSQNTNQDSAETTHQKESQPWLPGIETRFQVLTSQIFRQAGYKYVSSLYKDKENDILVFGNLEVALAIFKGFRSPKNPAAIPIPKTVGKVIFMLDDEGSKEPMKLLSIPNMHKTIRDYAFQNERIYNSITEDGVMNGRDSILWLDNDLRRLSMALYKKDRAIKEFQILCLESQAVIVEEISKIYKNEGIDIFISRIKYEDALEVAEGKVIADA